MGTVITLPRELLSRPAAHRLIPRSIEDTDIVLNADTATHVRTGAADELVKSLLATGAHRVIVVNAGPALERQLRLVHRARARPERTFLLTFQTVPAEALLRPA